MGKEEEQEIRQNFTKWVKQIADFLDRLYKEYIHDIGRKTLHHVNKEGLFVSANPSIKGTGGRATKENIQDKIAQLDQASQAAELTSASQALRQSRQSFIGGPQPQASHPAQKPANKAPDKSSGPKSSI